MQENDVITGLQNALLAIWAQMSSDYPFADAGIAENVFTWIDLDWMAQQERANVAS